MTLKFHDPTAERPETIARKLARRRKLDVPPSPAIERKVDAYLAYALETQKLEDELADNADTVCRALACESVELLARFSAWLEARETARTGGKVQRHGATRKSEDGVKRR